jgi:hypothetical protein
MIIVQHDNDSVVDVFLGFYWTVPYVLVAFLMKMVSNGQPNPYNPKGHLATEREIEAIK